MLTVLVARPVAGTVPAGVHTLTPAPASVVATGAVAVEAWIATDEAPDRVDVRLDGTPVLTAQVGQRDATRGWPVRAVVDVDAGPHELWVRSVDGAGGEAQRAWRFAASTTTFERIAGADRYATAAALSRAAFPADGSASAAVLARADDFADALAGAPLARALGGPLLLSHAAFLTEATEQELLRVLEPDAEVHLLGGEAALARRVATRLEGLGFTPVRHDGADRFATAAAVANALPTSEHAFVVSGSSFPDALAASVAAARDGSPILLSPRDALPDATAAALEDRAVQRVTIVGGPAVVGDDVETALRERVTEVTRVAGADRYATAAAVAADAFPDATTAALANGTSFADALAGAPLLAGRAQPLLLTDPHAIPAATVGALRTAPAHVTVLGGNAAVSERIVASARAATAESASAPLITSREVRPDAVVRRLDVITVRVDRDLATSGGLYATVDGTELAGIARRPDPRTLQLTPDLSGVPYEVPFEVQVHVALPAADGGAVARSTWAFTLVRLDPHFGDAGPVPLHLPSRDVELIGFHESNHDGARQIEVRPTSTATMTMETRSRGTGSRSAADIVANPDLPVYAPATGRVLRAGTYRLYCDHVDHFLVIEPDAAPGWEVKVLHFRDLAVAKGDRVIAGQTRIGSGPRALPFESQVDEHSHPRDWPHLHVEVVDPSIPDRPGSGC